MICNRCGQEFGGDDEVCPHCRGAAVFAAPPQAAPALDLGTTLSVSGSGSIRGRLRPRSVVGILAESLRIYREHWQCLSLVVLALAAPFQLFAFLVERSGGAEAHAGALVAVLPTLLIQFAIVKAVSNIYLGRRVSVRQVMPWTGRFGSYFLSGFVGSCAIVIPVLIVVTLWATAATSHRPSIAAAAAGGAVCAALLLLFTMWIGIAGAAVIVEGIDAFGALRRSARLLKGFVGRAAGVCLLQLLLAFVISGVIGMVSQLCLGDFRVGEPAYCTLARQLADLVGTVFSTPLSLLPLVLFYFDIRIRKEGFDLEVLSQQIGYGVVPQSGD